MTMERVYNPHQQQQLGFQQQQATAHAVAAVAVPNQPTSLRNRHQHQPMSMHPNQHRYTSAPSTTTMSQTTQPPLPQSHQQTREDFNHHAQQAYQHTYTGNHQYLHNHPRLGNQQQDSSHQPLGNSINLEYNGQTTTGPPVPIGLHRPVHPPPPPPAHHNQQPTIFQNHHSQSGVRQSLFVPPMMTSDEAKANIENTAIRSSLPAPTTGGAGLVSTLPQRNSLQNTLCASTSHDSYQQSTLRRYPNQYVASQQQALQSITQNNSSATIMKNSKAEQPSETFESVSADHVAQDEYTELVIQAILAGKDALEKPIEERDEHDIMLIDNLCSLIHGFDAFPKRVRRALAAQTVLIVIDEKGKVLIVNNEELDSFCVLIFGECEQLDESKTVTLRSYRVGDAFGVCEPTTDTIRFVGHMVTKCENCAFLCVKRDDFYTILTDPANYPNKEIIRHRDKTGNIFCISQFDIDRKSSGPLWSCHMQSRPFKVVLPDGHVIIKATESCLLTALVDGYERLDPDYIDDFLLLFRVFMTWDIKDREKKLPPGMIKLCLSLTKWLDDLEFRDRIVKVLLTWLSSYYHDFELNAEFSYLFFRLLEFKLLSLGLKDQLHLLYVTLTTQSKPRLVTISRSSREQPLAFSIGGGYDKNCGIFVTQVHGSSFDELPQTSLMSYLNCSFQSNQDKPSLSCPVIPPRHKSANYHQSHNGNNFDINNKINALLKPGDQILEVNGTNFAAIKLQEAQKKLDMSTHLSLTVRYNPSAYHEMRTLPEGKRKSSVSSLSLVSPHFQTMQKFTFNSNEQSTKNLNDNMPLTSPLFSANANFGFRSIIKSAPKNDRSRLSNLISSSKQLVKHIRDSTGQTNALETASKTSDNISDDQNAESESHKVKSNMEMPNLKGKDKQIEYGLSNVVRSDDLSTASVLDNGANGCSNETLINVLRVFNAANNDSRYLLVHEETTAREVVMVAVKEFNLTASMNAPQGPVTEKTVSSLNWHLYEVSVVPESRTIKQKCLSEQTSRLAERASLCSRLYIKNNSQSCIGPSKLDMGDDALVNEILKESPANLTLTSLNATLLAVELTLADFEKFRKIEPQQFVYDTFFNCTENDDHATSSNGSISSHDSASLRSSSSDGQESADVLHSLNKTRYVPKSWMREYYQFADISNREMFWVICEILNERNISRRVKIVKQFVRVADVCSQLRNYNSMFAIISGLGHSCVARLRRTFEKLKPKYKNQLEKMRSLFDPSRNMSNYRICLSQTQPPAIPLFPQIKKDLTFTKEGRFIFIRESNDLSDDEDSGFSQDTIKRKIRGSLVQPLAISNKNFSNSTKVTNCDGDSILINFSEIRHFTERVRNVIYFSSIPYSNDLLTNTKDSQRNQAQIKKMHEEWQMRKRIRHYINQTLTSLNNEGESSSVGASRCSFDQTDGISGNNKQMNGRLIISYDERTLHQRSLEVEPEINSRPQTVEPRHVASSGVQATQALQVHLPPPQVVPILSIQQALQPLPANSSPTLSKSSSLSSCSSFSHHLPNYHAARGSSNLSSNVGKFGTESTESLRKLQALSENVDDWRSSSNNNRQNHGSSNHNGNGISRMAGDARGGIGRNLVPSRIFPSKNGR